MCYRSLCPHRCDLKGPRTTTQWSSIFFGPVLLAGALGRDKMPNDFADKDAYLKMPPAAVPDIVSTVHRILGIGCNRSQAKS